MPFTQQQKLQRITPRFIGSRKPMQDYIRLLDVDTLFTIDQRLGAGNFSKMVHAFYPDKFKSLYKGLTGPEFSQLAGMHAATLNSLGELASPEWVKTVLRIISATVPVNFITVPPAPGPGILTNHAGNVDQTSTQNLLVNTCVTELNPAGNATRNLIFSALGNCVAEINFANHGGSAVSGHAHVYPIKCVPLTGHHVMGTPHINMADYPMTWRQLPAGVNPATALGG